MIQNLNIWWDFAFIKTLFSLTSNLNVGVTVVAYQIRTNVITNNIVKWSFFLNNLLNLILLGAQKEGAAGFFKGVGKGLVGAVARPTGGIIDMASSTFQGIKK